MSDIKYLEPIHLSDAKQTTLPTHSQTASGYGMKLRTSYMIQLVGRARWYRVYCACFSNAGSCYIVRNGDRYYTGRIESQIEILVKGSDNV